ncbi:14319_t:CDS:2 [Cetraspora pellucida]|uniref:14319_t:CDS:1 n=1 Tax=Cetraspora pellucida TaxID=1433469 RepID=A0A9N9ACP3_9GLOM|nr:14319_t:CDS:2 [Cetraspora pellucida]
MEIRNNLEDSSSFLLSGSVRDNVVRKKGRPKKSTASSLPKSSNNGNLVMKIRTKPQSARVILVPPKSNEKGAVKRKRGRPPKNRTLVSPISSNVEVAVPRMRGKPPKYHSDIIPFNSKSVMPKRRGRPPKSRAISEPSETSSNDKRQIRTPKYIKKEFGTNSRIQVKCPRSESRVVSVLIEQKAPYMINECNSIDSNDNEKTEAFTQVNEPVEPSAIIWLPKQNESTGAFRIGANDVLMGINRNNSYIEDTLNSITEQENVSDHSLAFDAPSVNILDPWFDSYFGFSTFNDDLV